MAIRRRPQTDSRLAAAIASGEVQSEYQWTSKPTQAFRTTPSPNMPGATIIPEGVRDWRDALAACGADFEVETAPVMHDPWGDGHMEPCGFNVIRRADTKRILSSRSVSDRYEVWQAHEMGALLEALAHDGAIRFTQGGLLRGDSMVFLVAELDEVEGVGGAPIKRQMCTIIDHSGQGRNRIFWLQTNLWCANQLRALMSKAMRKVWANGQKVSNGVSLRHSKASKSTDTLQAAREVLGLAQASMDALIRFQIALAEARINDEQTMEFVRHMMPTDDEKDVPTKTLNRRQDLLRSIHEAPAAAPGTAYGLIQGITYYNTHVRGQNREPWKRTFSLVLGTADNDNQRALQYVHQLVA